MREIDYWIWLSTLTGLGPVKVAKLLNTYIEPKLIFDLRESELRENRLLTQKNISELLDQEKRCRIEEVNTLMVKNDIKMVNIFDSKYPDQLKQIYDPPIALYYKGELRFTEFSIAVVGSRRTTHYGSLTARKLAYDLALRGVQIISGLARGIDSIAHEGCLDAGGRTIAVLGCGPDYIYPPENGELYEGILKSGGLILSEYAPGTPPLQHNFPARNRIISGMASGVLVVEAAKRSGSLITAGFALEQGREVFAVPGNIDCAYSRGTNQLIHDGAKMVLSVEDILEEFDYRETKVDVTEQKDGKRDDIFSDQRVYRGLSTEEIRIVKIIQRGIYQIDEITEKSNIPVRDINNILFMLEMKGVIHQLPGKQYEMCF